MNFVQDMCLLHVQVKVYNICINIINVLNVL